MAEPQNVTDAEFEKEVLKVGIPVLRDFWAEWCGPCYQIASNVEALADEYEGRVKFVKLDTEENFDITAHYGVRSLPTLLMIKGGQRVDQVMGYKPKVDLNRFLEKVLA